MSCARPSERLYNSFLGLVAVGSLAISGTLGSHLWNNRQCITQAVGKPVPVVGCLDQPSETQRKLQLGGIGLALLGTAGMMGVPRRPRTDTHPKG